jgi:hypothetical protein
MAQAPRHRRVDAFSPQTTKKRMEDFLRHSCEGTSPDLSSESEWALFNREGFRDAFLDLFSKFAEKFGGYLDASAGKVVAPEACCLQCFTKELTEADRLLTRVLAGKDAAETTDPRLKDLISAFSGLMRGHPETSISSEVSG